MKNLKLKFNSVNLLRISLFVLVSFILFTSFSINIEAAGILQSINNAASNQTGGSSGSNTSSGGSILQNVNNSASNQTGGSSSNTNSNGSILQNVNNSANNLNNAANCIISASTVTADVTKINDTAAQAVVTNKTNCDYDVHIASFKVYDNKETGGIPQTLISSENRIVPAHSTHVFTIAIAPCLSQVDVWVSSVTLKGVIFGVDGRVFNNIPSAQGLFCGQSYQPQSNPTPATFINTYVPPTTPPVTPVASLTGVCSVNPGTVNTDQHVNWLATAAGGNGNYSYSWTGTDGLNGNSSYVSKLYFTSGVKNGTVTITSGGQTITRDCSVTVNSTNINPYVPTSNLSATCNANPSNVSVGQRMNWSVDVSGGNGNYNYAWSGTDGLYSTSQSPSMVYNTAGGKSATVQVWSSDGRSLTRTCYTNVQYQNSVLGFSQSYQAPMASAVYLSQIPYTGFKDNFGFVIFICLLSLFSAWVAYFVTSYQKNNS